MGEVTIFVLYVIVCAFYTMCSSSMLCLGNFVIYISCSGVILTLHKDYICVSMDIFVHHIAVSELISLCELNNIIVVCTSSWVYCTISLLCIGYSSTLFSLHSYLY